MALETHEFIRRFLIHVLPKGQHRIRHYGLFANGNRAANIAHIRELLVARAPAPDTADTETADTDTADTDTADTAEAPRMLALPCPCCGGRLIIVAAFGPGGPSQHHPRPGGHRQLMTPPKRRSHATTDPALRRRYDQPCAGDRTAASSECHNSRSAAHSTWISGHNRRVAASGPPASAALHCRPPAPAAPIPNSAA